MSPCPSGFISSSKAVKDDPRDLMPNLDGVFLRFPDKQHHPSELALSLMLQHACTFVQGLIRACKGLLSHLTLLAAVKVHWTAQMRQRDRDLRARPPSSLEDGQGQGYVTRPHFLLLHARHTCGDNSVFNICRHHT